MNLHSLLLFTLLLFSSSHCMDLTIPDYYNDSGTYFAKLPNEIKHHVDRYVLGTILPLIVKNAPIKLPEPIVKKIKEYRSSRAMIFTRIDSPIDATFDTTSRIVTIKNKRTGKEWKIQRDWPLKIINTEYKESKQLIKINSCSGNIIYSLDQEKILYERKNPFQWNDEGTKIIEVKDGSLTIIDLDTKIELIKLPAPVQSAHYRPAIFSKDSMITGIYTVQQASNIENVSDHSVYSHAAWDISALLNFEAKLKNLSPEQNMKLALIHRSIQKNPTQITDAQLSAWLEPIQETIDKADLSIIDSFKQIRNSYIH